MFDDEYGNKVSTNSSEAVDAYNRGIHQFLGAEPGVEESFRSAMDADPEFALAHIGYAREMQLRGRYTEMRQALNRAIKCTVNLSAREQSHLLDCISCTRSNSCF